VPLTPTVAVTQGDKARRPLVTGGLVLHRGPGSGGRGSRRALASRRPQRSPAGAAVRR